MGEMSNTAPELSRVLAALTDRSAKVEIVGLVNDKKSVAEGMGIDTFELIDTSEMKPLGLKKGLPQLGLCRHFLSFDSYGNLTDDGENLEFSDNFVELHTQSYAYILNSNSYPLFEARHPVAIVETPCHLKPLAGTSDQQPFLSR